MTPDQIVERLERLAAEHEVSPFIRDMLALCTAYREATEWRGIESAPRDGTRILLSNAHVGRWSTTHKKWIMERQSNNDQWPEQPTHFRLLPLPPQEEK